MFGKKKKELEAKKLEEQQPLPIETDPAEDFLDAEIILDDIDSSEDGEMIDIDAVDDFAALNKTISIDPAIIASEESFEESAKIDSFVDEPIVEEALIADEPIADEPIVEAPIAEEPILEEEPVEDILVEDATPEDVNIDENAPEDSEDNAESESNEEVVYVVDGPEEDDEIVKPAKLVKLPHLIDYMLMADPKPSKRQLLKYATMLTELYQNTKTPDDKAIVKSCVLKIANALRK